MKNNWYVIPAIFLAFLLSWGCTKEPDDTTHVNAEPSVNNTHQISGGYRQEDFMWIKPGEHNYFDIIEVFPNNEPVIQVSPSTLTYSLANGEKIGIRFGANLIVESVWLVDKDSEVYRIIPAT